MAVHGDGNDCALADWLTAHTTSAAISDARKAVADTYLFIRILQGRRLRIAVPRARYLPEQA